MTAWLIERLKNVWFYAIIILAIGFVGLKFLQRTEKTVVQSGGQVVNTNKDAKVNVYPFGCANFQAERYMKSLSKEP